MPLNKRVYCLILFLMVLTSCTLLAEGDDLIGSGADPLVGSLVEEESGQDPALDLLPEEGTTVNQDAGLYPIIDSGQDHCYSDSAGIPCPEEGERYYGQDAQYQGIPAEYVDNGDGTVTDLISGLMWQAAPDQAGKFTFAEALAGAESFELAGYDDWRLPSIKELYSLIDFNGSVSQVIPYINTEYFSFSYGDESQGERQIDAQYWSSTTYVGTTMNGNSTVFGVNFADGRIKGYPAQTQNGREMEGFVMYVRGNPDYGINQFQNNQDGTISDLATGLVWQESDSSQALDWEGALAYCEDLTLAGENDWRLPNAKELQSIVDYTRSPQTSSSAALDPLFSVSEIESWFWTSTTHLDVSPANAIYIAFGQAFGLPDGQLIDVHGAGAQRSDPKSGDPADYSEGRGSEGQADQVRIDNYARCVRSGVSSEIMTGGEPDLFSGRAGNGQQSPGNFPQPPQAAIAACEEIQRGDECSFSSPQGPIYGTCQAVGSEGLACVPAGPPP